MNLDQRVSSWLSLGAGANYVRSNTNLVINGENGFGGLLTAAVFTPTSLNIAQRDPLAVPFERLRSEQVLGEIHSVRLARPCARLQRMQRSPLEELGARVEAAIRGSPIEDLQKNLRALLVAFFDRFDVVPREDFEVQRRLLARAQEKLAALEARVAELEADRGHAGKPPG